MRTVPSRTCLGCRRARPKDRLVRLVRLGSGAVVVDPGARAAGRGAYVCPESACVEQALIRGRLARAFRMPCTSGADLALAVLATGRRGAELSDDVGAGAETCEAGVMAARA